MRTRNLLLASVVHCGLIAAQGYFWSASRSLTSPHTGAMMALNSAPQNPRLVGMIWATLIEVHVDPAAGEVAEL